MLYLLDASVLITANNLYYPLDGVPEFWEWLEHMCAEGRLKMPIEIFEEVTDDVGDWLREQDRKAKVCLDEQTNVDLVRECIERGYAPDLNESEVLEMGNDPFLIASAMAARDQRVVVTTEVSKPTKRRANRHIPDVCESVDVKWCDSFTMLRTLGFSTRWREQFGVFA